MHGKLRPVHRYDPARQKLALGLAFLAGAVDATGFLATGGYFASFMSGNTTRLGVDLATTASAILLPLAIIGSFVSGVVMGAIVAGRWPAYRKRALLLGVSALLGVGALAHFLGSTFGFLLPAACAMGLANNVFSKDGEVTVGVTYMTGALVRFGQGIAAQLTGRSAQGMRGYGLLWLALALGACGGGWVYAHNAVIAPPLLCALAVLLFSSSWLIERTGPIDMETAQP
ncbi:YoaK family protein [Qipengyuania sp. RANM35]|uniref:YoaK family protein n=1 Tax=Qipengyuania sp. RANM35 TaxID=3068635 RepID=UPI0034DB34FA